MKHLIYCVLIIALMSVWGTAVYAEKVEEFEHLFNELVDNYENVKKYKNSDKYTRQYEKKLSELSSRAREIQKLVVKLKIKDMNFPSAVNSLKEKYYNMKRGSKVKRRNRLGSVGGSDHAVHKIESYLKKLKKMQFSVEKQSYKKELREEEGMDEFNRLLRQYSRNIKKALTASKKAHWLGNFEDKLSRMVFLGREIQTKINKKKIKMKFSKEVIYLSDAYKKSGFTNADRSILRNEKVSKSSSRTRVKAKYEALMNDISLSIKTLQEYLLQLKEKNFVLYPEIKKRNKERKVVDLDEEFMPDKDDEESVEKDYEVMTKEELIAELRDERKKIYKSNKQLGGVSNDVADKYLDTLTKKQKKHYKYIQKKYSERGYGGREAASYALIEVHSIYLNKNTGATKKELISILKKLDKEKRKD